MYARLRSCLAQNKPIQGEQPGRVIAARRRRWPRAATWVVSGLLALSSLQMTQAITLGTAEEFAVLGGSTVTNTGPTVITGELGVSPGSAITGFPPGLVVNGTIHSNDAMAVQAHTDASTAFTQLGLEIANVNLSGQNLGGLTLMPGIYRFDTSAQLTGTLSLDTGADPNAVFHFQIGSDLTTAVNSSIQLLNGSSSNIFWQVGTSATLGIDSSFVGTIIADQSISLNTGATLDGRALAINGAVTLDTNTITVPLQPELGTPGVTITGAGTDLNNPNFTLGFEFNTSTAISVTDLGYFDFGSDGLAESHQVGLWDSTGNLLATAVVPAGTGGTLDAGGFRFVPITPVTLLTGNYWVAGYNNPSGADRYVYGVPISTAPGISYVGDRSSFGSFSAPTELLVGGYTSTSSAAVFGGNFAFQAIPEPSTALAAMGLLGLSAMSRWRRGRAPAL